MKCNADEVCQVENGVRGCYPKQCLLKAEGIFTLFNGTTWDIPSMGAFDLLKVCDDTATGIWFRVVAVLQERTRVLSNAAVHIFFENVLVTVTAQNEIWVSENSSSHSVHPPIKQTFKLYPKYDFLTHLTFLFQFNGRKMTQSSMENNEVIVKVTDQTVIIEKIAAVRLSYSVSQGVIITLNEGIADKVCGACGKLTGSTPGGSIMFYMDQFRALDFPTW